jgi:hypothetical protein
MPLTNAEKQSRFREKRDAELNALREQSRAFLDAFADACDRGRCSKLTNHLPDDPHAALAELAERLREKRVIVCGLE